MQSQRSLRRASNDPFCCTEQELEADLTKAGVVTHLVGGADVASELDAKRAIDQSTRLAVMIEQAAGKVPYEPGTRRMFSERLQLLRPDLCDGSSCLPSLLAV